MYKINGVTVRITNRSYFFPELVQLFKLVRVYTSLQEEIGECWGRKPGEGRGCGPGRV